MIPVHSLDLGSVRLPDWHPRAADATCIIRGWAIEHPDGVIVFDTGVADDHPLINELYAPTVVGVVDALASAGIDERDVTAVVNSHLHFDHCGQNRSFPAAPVYAQRAEVALVDAPRYTVPDWARIDVERLRAIDGDHELTAGVTIVATPGHTPGHQALVVDDGECVTVLAGQCCSTCAEFDDNDPAVADVHDETWLAAAHQSIDRLRSFAPDTVHLAHDAMIWRSR